MGSINDNADEVQNQEVGEELAPQPVTQTEDGERDSGVQGPDAVHALGEELARMFDTGSVVSAGPTSTAMVMPFVSVATTSGGTNVPPGEREFETPGVESGSSALEINPSDDCLVTGSEGDGEVAAKPAIKKARKTRNPAADGPGLDRPFTRSRRRSMERRSETTNAPDGAEPSPMLTSSFGRGSTTTNEAGSNERGGQLLLPQHQIGQRNPTGDPVDSLYATTPAVNQPQANWPHDVMDRDRVNVTDNETLRPNVSEVTVVERATSNAALAESTLMEPRGRHAIQRDSGRMIDQLVGNVAGINSQLQAAVQRTRLSSAEHAMIQQRNKREGESMFIPHSTAWMKRSQGDMVERMRNDYSIPRDFIHLAESVTDWTDSPSGHKSASNDWDEVFDQTQEIIQSQLGIQRKLVEMIDGLDLGEEAVLRLRKIVDSAID